MSCFEATRAQSAAISLYRINPISQPISPLEARFMQHSLDDDDDDNKKKNSNILRQIQHLTDPKNKVKFVAPNLLEQSQQVKWLRASSTESLNKRLIRKKHPYQTSTIIENSDLLNILNNDSDTSGYVDT